MYSADSQTEAAFVSKYLLLDGTRFHYLEAGSGSGAPIIFLHSLPASSWVWRKIIPRLASLGRCIALDFAGFGKSGDPDIPYTLQDHQNFLQKFIKELNLDRMTFVLHGWGSIIGLDYAMRYEKQCRALVFYEAWLCPAVGSFISLPYQEHIQSWLTLNKRNEIKENGMRFVSQTLQQMTLHPFNETLLAHYCASFLKPGAGQVLAEYLASAPKGDGCSEADRLIAAYSEKLQRSSLPKLLLYSLPGFVMTMNALTWAKQHLSHLEVVSLGEELHYAQESVPTLMAEAMSVWLQAIEQIDDRIVS